MVNGKDQVSSPLAEAMLEIGGESLEAMTTILADLGDDLANRRPSLDGANSPYAIVFHCVGMLEHWLDQ